MKKSNFSEEQVAYAIRQSDSETAVADRSGSAFLYS